MSDKTKVPIVKTLLKMIHPDNIDKIDNDTENAILALLT